MNTFQVQPKPYTGESLPGIWTGEPNEAYHASGAIGISTLNTFRESRRQYRYGSRESTPAMDIGTALHTLLLEPKTAGERILFFDMDFPWQKKVDKETAAYVISSRFGSKGPDEIAAMTKREVCEFVREQTAGRVVLSPEEANKLTAAQKAVEAHETASRLFAADGWNEITFRSEKLAMGYPVQCRPDRLIIEGGVPHIVDLKKIEDLAMVVRNIKKYRYWRIPEFYRQVIRACTGWKGEIRYSMVFAEVRKDDLPPGVEVWRTDEDTDAEARYEIEEDMAELSLCMQRDDWREPRQKADVNIFTLEWRGGE